MLSPTCVCAFVCVWVVRLTQICRSVNVSSTLQVSQPRSGSTQKKKKTTFYQPNSPRLTRLLPFMLQYQQIKRQNLPPHQGNPVRGRARGESTALWKFHLCTVSHWYGAMMPGIYENSKRFEEEKPRGKCWSWREWEEGGTGGRRERQKCNCARRQKYQMCDERWGKKRVKVQELIKRQTEGGGSEEKTAKQEKKFVKKYRRKKKAKRLFWLRQLVIRRIIIILKQRPYNSRSPGLICRTFNTTHALLSPFTLPQLQLIHNNNKKLE